jgi:hypothetical protein
MEQMKKAMKVWKTPPYFWIAIEKGINHYATHPLKRDKDNMPPELQKPFGTTFYTPRNILQVAFRKQSHVGWENFLKGRICTEWCTYIKQHLTLINIKKYYQEWATKLILGSYIQGLNFLKHGTSQEQSRTGGALQRRGPSKTNGHHLDKARRPEGTVGRVSTNTLQRSR